MLDVFAGDAGVKVVSPYRPFEPVSGSHLRLGAFDWIGALRMLAESVRRSCHCETFALTDVDTTLPVPMIQVQTTERCLMRWIVEVSLRYLESPAFDQDTICISPDTLVTADLGKYFCGEDLGLLVRTPSKYKHRPILNSVQWWPVASREKLIGFYRRALAIARDLPSGYARWGADCECLRQLVAPIEAGRHHRAGLLVETHEAFWLLYSIPPKMRLALERRGRLQWPNLPVIDFKGWRKQYMARFYERAAAQKWAAA